MREKMSNYGDNANADANANANADAPRSNASGPPEPFRLGQPESPDSVNQNDVLNPPRAPGRPFGDNTAAGNRAGCPIPFVLPGDTEKKDDGK